LYDASSAGRFTNPRYPYLQSFDNIVWLSIAAISPGTRKDPKDLYIRDWILHFYDPSRSNELNQFSFCS
jgi:hypothetical protein